MRSIFWAINILICRFHWIPIFSACTLPNSARGAIQSDMRKASHEENGGAEGNFAGATSHVLLPTKNQGTNFVLLSFSACEGQHLIICPSPKSELAALLRCRVEGVFVIAFDPRHSLRLCRYAVPTGTTKRQPQSSFGKRFRCCYCYSSPIFLTPLLMKNASSLVCFLHTCVYLFVTS